MNRIETINLADYITSGSKVFTGRQKGESVRKDSKIDDLSKKADRIEVIVPENIYSINPSFLEELLINVVTNLGAEGFKAKFLFINNGKYKIAQDLEEAVERILREENALV
jgi:hypothetical protein